MKRIKNYIIPFCAAALLLAACKKDLDVQNPNQPTATDAQTESGIISLAKGAVYANGWNGVSLSGLNWLGSSFFSLVYGYQELMADVISATASNQNINVINLPAFVILDNGTKLTSTASQRDLLRISNSRASRTSNAFYYEWGYMYALNNACNNLLDALSNVTFSGDAETKMNTIKAWAYWWKGYAYSRIGSIYYAGLVNNTTLTTNANYVDHDAILAEASKNFDEAALILGSISNDATYSDILTQLIPEFTQVGHGGVLTPVMWLHSINTMKARNLLENKKISEMTSSDWANVLSSTDNGIQDGDFVFTARTTDINGFMNANSGSVAAMSTGTAGTFTVSERLIQEYKIGDKRLANNFSQRSSPLLNQAGGITFSTRWALVDGGNGISGVDVISDKIPGNYELYISGSYEENALMAAEALIYTGKINEGLALVDAVRSYQGAGIAAVSGTGLTEDQAIQEVRRERRVSLVFRGTSFYDYRRWGYIFDVANGGGRTGAVVLSSTGELSTNATINYNFLDYWDVPADETELNPPASGSAPIKNPG